ncbi:MAG: sugar phosphate isomerase/epimerase family protein [bacterium]
MKIFLSSWSFKRAIRLQKMTLLDLPQLAARHGFGGVEIMDRHLPPGNLEFIDELNIAATKNDCELILDVSSDLTAASDHAWSGQIEYVLNMLDLAKQLQVTKMRLLLGGQSFSIQKIFSKLIPTKSNLTVNSKKDVLGSRFLSSIFSTELAANLSHTIRKNSPTRIRHEYEKIQRALDALRKLVPQAASRNITLMIENHWGISSRPVNIVQMVDSVNWPGLGICVDFDNFPREVDPYQGVEILADRALHAHAKSYAFDERGEERTIDYSRALKILKDKGFVGSFTVEFEGRGDVLTGSLITKRLIEKCWPD